MAGRHDAVEHVDAAPHRLDEVLRPADAHEVARLGRGHVRHQLVENQIAFRFAFPDGQPADGETGEADLLGDGWTPPCTMPNNVPGASVP